MFSVSVTAGKKIALLLHAWRASFISKLYWGHSSREGLSATFLGWWGIQFQYTVDGTVALKELSSLRGIEKRTAGMMVFCNCKTNCHSGRCSCFEKGMKSVGYRGSDLFRRNGIERASFYIIQPWKTDHLRWCVFQGWYGNNYEHKTTGTDKGEHQSSFEIEPEYFWCYWAPKMKLIVLLTPRLRIDQGCAEMPTKRAYMYPGKGKRTGYTACPCPANGRRCSFLPWPMSV